MGRGVIAHGGRANSGINHGVDLGPNLQSLLCDYLVGAHALHRVIGSRDFGHYRVVVVGIEPPAVAHLSAGLRVERRVVEDDFAFLARFEFAGALALFQQCYYFAGFRLRLAIPFKHRRWQFLILGIGGLLGGAFPGSARALALLVHSRIKACLVEEDSLIARRVLHKVERHSEGVVELKCLRTIVNGAVFQFFFDRFGPEHHGPDANPARVFRPTSIVCAKRVSSASTAFETRSAVSFNSGYASCIRSRTENTISWRNGLSCPSSGRG